MNRGVKRRIKIATGAAILASLLAVRFGLVRLLRAPDPASHVVRAVSRTFRDVGPRWSHDGTRIAFLRLYDSGHVSLYAAPSDLSRVCMLTRPEVLNPDQPPSTGRSSFFAPDAPAWSPDDALLSFSRGARFTTATGDTLPGSAVWLFDLWAGRVQPLVIQPERCRRNGLTYRSASWSADGRLVAVVAQGPMDHASIIVTVRGSSRREVMLDQADASRDIDWPAWAPSGRRLAYAEGVMRGPHSARVAVLRVAEPGGSLARRLLTITPDAYARMCPEDVARHHRKAIQPYISGITWSRDGSEVMFSVTPDANDRSRYSIWRVRAGQAGQPRRLSPADGWGYMAPSCLAGDRVGAVRYRDGQCEAALLSLPHDDRPSPARRLFPLETDDLDFRADGNAIVISGGLSGDGGQTTLRVISVP